MINQKQVSQNTILSYRDTLRMLFKYISDQTGISPAKLELESLSVDQILEFLNYLEQNRGISARSRNQRLHAIKAFFHHIIFLEPSALSLVQQMLEIPNKRFVKPIFGHLSKEEMGVLLETPHRNSLKGRRDYTLILFMYNTGVRVSEAIQLQIENLHLKHPYHTRIWGKGRKERIVPLWKDTAKTLSTWLQLRAEFSPKSNCVFFNVSGTPLSRGGVAHILNNTVQIAIEKCPSLKRKKISPHTLRHTTAMHLLQSGVDINVIRMWLGHVGLDTTHQYIEADLEMKRQALEKGGIIAGSQESTVWKPTDELIAFLDSL